MSKPVRLAELARFIVESKFASTLKNRDRRLAFLFGMNVIRRDYPIELRFVRAIPPYGGFRTTEDYFRCDEFGVDVMLSELGEDFYHWLTDRCERAAATRPRSTLVLRSRRYAVTVRIDANNRRFWACDL